MKRSDWKYFWRGFGSVVDLFSTRYMPAQVKLTYPHEDGLAEDQRKLAGDWQAVNADLLRAIEKLRQEENDDVLPDGVQRTDPN